MRRSYLLLPSLLLLSSALGLAQSGQGIHGRIDGQTYYAPSGTYHIQIPVLPELGGTVSDTQNVVVFQDDYNVHVSIGAFPQDPTQRWELATRGLKDYLTYFFTNYVLPDFTRTFVGTKTESAVFNPKQLDGALIVNVLLPGGSMFAQQLGSFRNDDNPPVAKRGNLLFIQHNVVYVVSIELAERVIEGDHYKKTPAEEDDILRERLNNIVNSMMFTTPPAEK